MAFFKPQQLKPRTIEIDADSPTAEHEQIQRRLELIEANYQRLDQVLGELEDRMASDPRFLELEIDEAQVKATRPKTRRRASSRRSRRPRQPR